MRQSVNVNFFQGGKNLQFLASLFIPLPYALVFIQVLVLEVESPWITDLGSFGRKSALAECFSYMKNLVALVCQFLDLYVTLTLREAYLIDGLEQVIFEAFNDIYELPSPV